MQVSNGASSKKKTTYDKSHSTKKASTDKGYIGNTLINPKQVGHGNASGLTGFKKIYEAIDKANNSQLFNQKSKSGSKNSNKNSKSTTYTSAYNKMKAIENASNNSKQKTPTNNTSTKQNTQQKSVVSKTISKSKQLPSVPKKPTVSNKVVPKKTTPVKPTTTQSSSLSSVDQKKKAYLDSLKKNSDGYFKSQNAMFAKQRDDAINQQKQAYQNAVDQGQISIDEATKQFEADKKAIDQHFYQQAQATNITAYDNGIQNSMQMLGLQAGDNARQQGSVDTAMSTRDQQINDIKNRLSSLASTRDLNIAGINSDYGYNVAGAKGQADQMYNSGVSDFMANDITATQNHDWNVQDMTTKHNWDVQDANTAFNRSKALQASKSTASGTKKSSTSVSKSIKPIAQAYGQFKATKSNTNLDQYYKKQTALNKGSVVQKNPALPPVSVANNQTLSPWQKYKIVMGG